MTSSSSPRLAAADVYHLVRLLRAHGWKHSRSFREFDGDLLRVNSWSRGEQLIEAIFPAPGELVSLNYMDVDTDDSLWSVCNMGILNRAGLSGVVDVAASLGILPAHFSSAFAAGRESALHVPNDIEATGGCCCNGCIGQGMCDLYDPCDADERAENDAERIAEMTGEELDGWGK